MMRPFSGNSSAGTVAVVLRVIDLGHAEVRIVLGLAFFRRDPDALAVERNHDLVAVEVVAGGDRPGQLDPLFLIELGAELEGLIGRHRRRGQTGAAAATSRSNNVTKPRMRT